MTDLVNAFMGVFDPVSFALITGGTIFGIIFGAIPGLTATLAVILLIPLSYGLEPTQGISMLVGVYIGGISGGVVAAVLLGMPGTPSSMVTVLDGFALAKQGRAGKALGAGVTANLAGSFIGWLFLIALAPQVARFALEFGPIENTAVLLFGFTAVISLSGGSITKGICMTALGMAFSTVGVDPISSMERNTLGFSVLTNGISQMPAMIGLFVVAQAFAEMDTLSERFIIAASRLTDRFMSLTELRASLPNFIRSGLIGTAIGILPGIGGTLASVVAYDQQKRAAKHPENYGRGELQGIIASETANNATIGGALIPFLALGIPGDTVTAALLGGLQIHGLDPGPILFSRHMDMVYGVFVAFILSCVVMYVFMQFVGTYVFPVALRLQKKYGGLGGSGFRRSGLCAEEVPVSAHAADHRTHPWPHVRTGTPSGLHSGGGELRGISFQPHRARVFGPDGPFSGGRPAKGRAPQKGLITPYKVGSCTCSRWYASAPFTGRGSNCWNPGRIW